MAPAASNQLDDRQAARAQNKSETQVAFSVEKFRKALVDSDVRLLRVLVSTAVDPSELEKET